MGSYRHEDHLWLHPTCFKEEFNNPKEEVEKELEYLLKPDDYRLFINPKVLGETFTNEYAWEYCLSFPNMRCMVKRPIGIHVSFLDEQGQES